MEPPLFSYKSPCSLIVTGRSWPLDRNLCPPLPHPTRSGCLPFCPSCLFYGFWAASTDLTFNNSFLAPTVWLLHFHDIWLPGGFLSSASSHDNLLRWLQGAHCSWVAGSERGIWGDVSSSYRNYLFQRSSLFLPCSTLAANLHFFLVEQKHASGWAEELHNWVCPPVCTWGKFCFEHKVLFGHSANWLWSLSAVEDHLCWASVFTGLPISQHIRGFVAVLIMVGECCVPFVWPESL